MADKTMSLITQLSLNDADFKKGISKVNQNVKDLITGVNKGSGNIYEMQKALNSLKNVSFAGKTTEQIDAINTRVKTLNSNIGKLKAEQGAASSEVSSGFGGIGKAMAGLFAVGEVISFGKEAVKAADEASKANKNLLFSVNGNKDAYNKLYEQAELLRDTTGISDESIKQIQQLAAGAGYSTDRVEKLTRASVELSKKTGMDLQSAYLQLNVTLSGSVGRLKRVDPAFASLTKEQLKNGAAIDLVNSKYGGFAENMVTNIDRSGIAWKEYQKSVGFALKSSTDALFGFITSIFKAITPTETLSSKMEEERIKVNGLVMALNNHNLSATEQKNLINQIKDITPEFNKILDKQTISYKDLNAELVKYNKNQINIIAVQTMGDEYAKSAKDAGEAKLDLTKKQIAAGELAAKMYEVLNKSREKTNVNIAKQQFEKDSDINNYLKKLDILDTRLKGQLKPTYGNVGMITPKSEGDNPLNVINDIVKAQEKSKKLNDDAENSLKKRDAIAKKLGVDLTPKKVKENKVGGSDDVKDETYSDWNTANSLKNIKALAEGEKEKIIASINEQLNSDKKKVESFKWSKDEKEKAYKQLEDDAKNLKEVEIGKIDKKNEDYFTKLIEDEIKTFDDNQQKKKQALLGYKIQELNIHKEYNKLFNLNDKDTIQEELDLEYNDSKEKILLWKATTKEEIKIQKDALDELDRIRDKKGKNLKINGTTDSPKTLSQIKNEAKLTIDDMNKMVNDGVKQLATTAVDSIAKMIVDKGNIGDLFKGILSVIGQFMSTMGAALLATAEAVAAFKNLLAIEPELVIPYGIALITGGAVVSAIASKGFANGGIVGGSSYSGDRIHAYVNSDEVILNSAQQAKTLFAIANGGSTSNNNSGSKIDFVLRGSDIHGSLTNYSKKLNKIR